ncbi:MAG: tripartite tricarboxylate transporter substrate binding protein, partial [Reyranellales bacterium]
MTIGRRGLLAGGGAALLGTPAFADTYPSKQIRWVIPFAPGGNYDVTSRLVADPMGRDLGQTG